MPPPLILLSLLGSVTESRPAVTSLCSVPSLCSLQDVSKRLSLPMDIRLPPEFLQKLQMESLELPKPLSRMSRRASLVSATKPSPGDSARLVSPRCPPGTAAAVSHWVSPRCPHVPVHPQQHQEEMREMGKGLESPEGAGKGLESPEGNGEGAQAAEKEAQGEFVALHNSLTGGGSRGGFGISSQGTGTGGEGTASGWARGAQAGIC